MRALPAAPSLFSSTVLAVAAVACACPAAESPVSVAFESGAVDTIYVRAAPLTRELPTPLPATVTVVDLDQAPPGADLADLLDGVAGVQVRRYGGLGAPAVPSVRGAPGAQIVLLVDGLPLTDARDGAVDLASLPLDRYATAEVYRGLAPARFGGPGGAGAVNLISRDAASEPSSLRLTAGSFGETGMRWIRGWRDDAGGRALLAVVHGRRTDNRFSYLDHNQTFAEAGDDHEATRANAWFGEWGANLAGRAETGGLRADAAAGFFRRDGGRPGPVGGFESPHAVVRHVREEVRLGLADADGRLRLDLHASRLDQRLHDDEAEVGGDPPGTVRGLSDDLGTRLVWSGRRELGAVGTLSWRQGADWRRQWYDERRPGVEDPLRVRDALTAFAGLQLDLHGPRLSLLPGWRWQRLEDDFPPIAAVPGWPAPADPGLRVQDDAMPSLGVVWEAAPARVFVDAHAARSVRAPTWTELFGDRRGIDGNPDLLPEQTTTWDLALRLRLRGGALRLRGAVFGTGIERTIVYRQSSWRTSAPENSGRVRATGFEAEAGGALAGGGDWAASLTWQRTRDRGDDPAYAGKELPYLPPLQVTLELRPALGPWRLGLGLVHEAASYRDRYNSAMERIDDRTVVNLSLSRGWRLPGDAGGRRATLGLSLLNLTDNDVYDVEGYPLPGRSLRASLTLH